MKTTVNGYEFSSDFDSGNLAKIQLISSNSCCQSASSTSTTHGISSNDNFSDPDAEFRAWTRSDCEGTEFQNANRTWFHFSVKTAHSNPLIKISIVNLNRQGKLFNHGMAPVFREARHNDQHEADLAQHWKRINEIPKYKRNDGQSIITFHHRLKTSTLTYFAFTYPFSYAECQFFLDKMDEKFCKAQSRNDNGIYYHREVLCKSLNGNNVDLITVSSYDQIQADVQEVVIDSSFMFPGSNRCLSFNENKKVVFITSRVHPGETPSSHVFNGFLNFVVSSDHRAVTLRNKYVFKMIAMLNPDGVIDGHYRTDTRGVNLNRVYNNPSRSIHPTICAARNLILYHHHKKRTNVAPHNDSLVFLYIDLHGHASKRGCFIFGNYFETISKKIDCMLFPKLLSMNCPSFDFLSCNFSLKNMVMSDRTNKTNKEGSGRVSIYKSTGLVRCYTLECNYNSAKPDVFAAACGLPEKYTPHTYSQVGKAIALTILDMTGDNCQSNVANSSLKNVQGVRKWLAKFIKGGFAAADKVHAIHATHSNPCSPKASKHVSPTRRSMRPSARTGAINRLHCSPAKRSIQGRGS